MTRLRVGIMLFILSWLPIAQIIIGVAHSNNDLTNAHSAQVVRVGVWVIQFVVGIIGIWLAGNVAMHEIKNAGWKKTPTRLWNLFFHGR